MRGPFRAVFLSEEKAFEAQIYDILSYLQWGIKNNNKDVYKRQAFERSHFSIGWPIQKVRFHKLLLMQMCIRDRVGIVRDISYENAVRYFGI